jgi:hypothetical protein
VYRLSALSRLVKVKAVQGLQMIRVGKVGKMIRVGKVVKMMLSLSLRENRRHLKLLVDQLEVVAVFALISCQVKTLSGSQEPIWPKWLVKE